MDKIWITGATGLLGRALMAEFAEAYEGEFVGTGYSRADDNIRKLDLRDSEAVEAFFETERPQYVVHSAAERRPDVSEKDPDGTWSLNVDSTRHLAELCNKHGAWLLYLSTDYVFDGTSPPYQPGDTPNPLNLYGKSKLAGEEALREVFNDYGILRVPILYGEVVALDESAVTVVALDLRKEPIPPQDDWATRYPTHVADVARVSRQMVEHRFIEEGFRGIFHWSGNEPFTKYEMACAMAPALGIDPESIPANAEPVDGTPRPQDCCLEISELESLAIGGQRDFTESVPSILKEFNNSV